MQATGDNSVRVGGRWGWTLAIVSAVTLLRVAYVLWWCPYGLVEDEAYYWLWSRHLDWSYLTKGPGVALTIALGTLIGGGGEGGVRLMAPVFGAVLAVGVAGIAGELADPERRGRARVWGAGLALLSPAFQTASILMTIDGPMLALWALATWAGVRALAGRGAWAWAAMGAAVGAGLLFKLTIGLVGLGFLIGAAAWSGKFELARGWWKWAAWGAGLMVLGLAPMVVWNLEHEWATVSHLSDHLQGNAEGLRLGRRVGWLAEYGGMLVLIGGPGLALGAGSAWIGFRRRAGTGSGTGMRACMVASLPVVVLYACVAMATRVEGNWALGGLVPLLGAAGAGVGMGRLGRGWHHVVRTAVGVGIVSGAAMLRADLIGRLPWVGEMVPVGRLMSGPRMAEGAERVLGEIEKGSGEPGFVIADHYGVASQLAFYMPGRRVGCWSRRAGRRTQFDVWLATGLGDPGLMGRDAVLIGGVAEDWEGGFSAVERIGPIAGDHRARDVFVGRTFSGFGAGAGAGGEAGHGRP